VAASLTDPATRFNVRTPSRTHSLYNHVGGLGNLRRELTLLGLRELGQTFGRAAVGRETDAAMIAMAEAYHSFVKGHPGVYSAILMSRWLRNDRGRGGIPSTTLPR